MTPDELIETLAEALRKLDTFVENLLFDEFDRDRAITLSDVADKALAAYGEYAKADSDPAPAGDFWESVTEHTAKCPYDGATGDLAPGIYCTCGASAKVSEK